MDRKKKFINFKNKKNSCWLDAVLILIANNATFKELVSEFPDSHIRKIISKYDEALKIDNLSDRKGLAKAQGLLLDVQKSTLSYLKKYLKFKSGEPESAFVALLNLIHHDCSNIEDELNVSWIWHKQCHNCNAKTKSNLITKTIITLPKIRKFVPESPVCFAKCTCKKEMELILEFKYFNKCIIYNFEKGAGNGSSIPLTFNANSRTYQLTSIVMYEKFQGRKRNHFVTWIRQPSTNMWLNCNDIRKPVIYFTKIQPALKLNDIYICLYEAFDQLGKAINETFSGEQITDTNVDIINLSDEEELKNDSASTSAAFNNLPKHLKGDSIKMLDFISSESIEGQQFT